MTSSTKLQIGGSLACENDASSQGLGFHESLLSISIEITLPILSIFFMRLSKPDFAFLSISRLCLFVLGKPRHLLFLGSILVIEDILPQLSTALLSLVLVLRLAAALINIALVIAVIFSTTGPGSLLSHSLACIIEADAVPLFLAFAFSASPSAKHFNKANFLLLSSSSFSLSSSSFSLPSSSSSSSSSSSLSSFFPPPPRPPPLPPL